jgi:hypothetical protein
VGLRAFNPDRLRTVLEVEHLVAKGEVEELALPTLQPINVLVLDFPDDDILRKGRGILDAEVKFGTLLPRNRGGDSAVAEV